MQFVAQKLAEGCVRKMLPQCCFAVTVGELREPVDASVS